MSVGGYNGIVTDGLVFYYDPYNSKSYTSGDTICYDLSKNQTSSYLSGNTFNGKGFVFDGVDDYIEVPNSSSIDSFTTGLTVNIMVEYTQIPSTNGNNYDSPMTKCTDSGWNDGFGFYWNNANGGEFNFFVNDYFLARAYENVGTSIPLTNYCGVYNGSNVLLYKNGVLNNIGSPLINNVENSGLQMNIGCGSASAHPYSGWFMDGIVYYVMIYDRPLTDDEILQNYNATKHRFR